MTAAEILCRLGPGHPQRQEAGRALRELLMRLASMPLRERHQGEVYRIPPEAREDLVQEIAFVVLRKSPLPVVGASDEECLGYLRSMLVNRRISDHRRTDRQRSRQLDERLTAADTQPGQAAGDGDLATESLARLRRLYEEALAARQERFRQHLDTAWQEILELHAAPITTRTLIERDQGVRQSEDPRAFKQLQDKMLKAHSRLREGLGQLIDQKHEAGELDAEEAAQLHRILRLLGRCQRRRDDGVQPAQGASR